MTKKQTILVYDPFSKELVAVSDIRLADEAKIKELEKIANKNVQNKVGWIQELVAQAKHELRMEFDEKLECLWRENGRLKELIKYLLGRTELTEEEISLYLLEGANNNEETN